MKTFYIEQLQIRNFGRIENEYIAFSPGLNTIEHEHGDEIKVAVRLLVDAFRFSGDVCDFVTPDTKISGKIILGSKKYGISRAPIKKNSKKLDKKIFLAEDLEFSKEKQSKEEFELSSFDDSGNDYSSKLMKYYNEDWFYKPGELSKLTNKLSETEFFRRQTRKYINDFSPIRLDSGKDFIFDIDKRGSFYVRMPDSKEHLEGYLNGTEKEMYTLLSFINVLKFWQGINEVRDFNHYDDPVIILDCLNKIGAAGLDIIVSEFKSISRQVIFINSVAHTVPKVVHYIL